MRFLFVFLSFVSLVVFVFVFFLCACVLFYYLLFYVCFVCVRLIWGCFYVLNVYSTVINIQSNVLHTVHCSI